MCENKRQYFSDDCQFWLTQNICTQKSSLHSTHEKSNFILFGSPFEKIELSRIRMSRRMKYLVARPTYERQSCNPRLVSHLFVFLRSVKFHFQPSPLYRVATSSGYFFCDFAFSPCRSFLVARKKRERKRARIDVVQFHSSPTTYSPTICLGY